MIKSLRDKFNAAFTPEKYAAYMEQIEAVAPNTLDFRNAETPIFIPKEFTKKMLDACESIIDVIKDDNFLVLTERSTPSNIKIPNENKQAEFIVFDFGICKNENGELEP
ncbi:MAG: hypothetical protein KA319_09305, partial [Ferruginibacter sp.]|nr:hypothetical protein [Ferruginibacter sp.]